MQWFLHTHNYTCRLCAIIAGTGNKGNHLACSIGLRLSQCLQDSCMLLSPLTIAVLTHIICINEEMMKLNYNVASHHTLNTGQV